MNSTNRNIHRPRAISRAWRYLGLGFLLLFLAISAAGVAAQIDATPDAPPDSEAGLAIYGERCANCHGERGLGDGELAETLANPPAPHASAEYLNEAIPEVMFQVITTGSIENSMPPFGTASSNPLTDDQRWDLVGAIFSLGTPIDSVEQGQSLYEANCLACHGPTGKGDGDQAAGLDSDPGDLSDLEYWATSSNQSVFEALLPEGQVTLHDYDLTQDELRPIVNYVRTFGYEYTNALARFEPLETAMVSGQIINGSTGGIGESGTEVLLRAFTVDLQVTLSLTQTVDANGGYQFELEDVPQDWFYRATVNYGGLDFSTDFGELSYLEPEIDLPIIIFEQTSDPAFIGIQQLHLITSFIDDRLDVTELYVVTNTGEEVFIGENGDAAQGTFKLDLPEGAEGVTFQRGFGTLDSFFPTDEVISLGEGWAMTTALRPGPASMTLLVNYTLPYDSEATLDHAVYYPATGATLVLPEVGVSIENAASWAVMGQQTLESGVFGTYQHDPIPAGSALDLRLSGRARAQGAAARGLVTGSETDLLAGGLALLVTALVAFVAVRQWRQAPDLDFEREALVRAIADLDDEYAAGLIPDSEYDHERVALKAELMAIWED